MSVSIHPAVDNGVVRPSGFAGGTLLQLRQPKPFESGVRNTAHNTLRLQQMLKPQGHFRADRRNARSTSTSTANGPSLPLSIRHPDPGTRARAASRRCRRIENTATRFQPSASYIPTFAGAGWSAPNSPLRSSASKPHAAVDDGGNSRPSYRAWLAAL